MDKEIIKTLVSSGQARAVITAKDAIDADRFTIDTLGIDAKLLMENAGKAVADAIIKSRQKDGYTKSFIIIFAGPGNNGADAIVAARHLLAQGIQFFLQLIGDSNKRSPLLSHQLALLDNAAQLTKVVIKPPALDGDDIPTRPIIIVDGIFGAGLNKAPQGANLQAIRTIKHLKKNLGSRCQVICIDIPSGLDLDAKTSLGQHVSADQTITFGRLKIAHISEPTKIFCGDVRAIDIGLFSASSIDHHWLHRKKTLLCLLKDPPINCYKGDFGRVLIMEGKPQFLGASRLSARSALRTGAGLVTIATAHDPHPAAFDQPEIMRLSMKDIGKGTAKIDALVVGPGISRDLDWQKRAADFLHEHSELVDMLVLDAEGLGLLTNSQVNLRPKFMVCTPHPGEAATLLACSAKEIEGDRFLAIERLAQIGRRSHSDIIWVLKGNNTLVRAACGKKFIFNGGIPLLAAGGSGDVLSGAIAGLYKQTDCPLAATLLAISLQIDAATVLSKNIFKGSFASELADVFPRLLKRRLNE